MANWLLEVREARMSDIEIPGLSGASLMIVILHLANEMRLEIVDST